MFASFKPYLESILKPSVQIFHILVYVTRKLKKLFNFKTWLLQLRLYTLKLGLTFYSEELFNGVRSSIVIHSLSFLLQHLHELHPALVRVLLLVSTLFTSLSKPMSGRVLLKRSNAILCLQYFRSRSTSFLFKVQALSPRVRIQKDVFNNKIQSI